MEDAISRHYSKLKEMQDQKKLEMADFEWRVKAERDIAHKEKEDKKQMIQDLRQDLAKQIQDNQVKRDQEKEEKKERISTNGGPGLNDEQHMAETKLTLDGKKLVQLQIMKQIEQQNNFKLQK